MEDMTKSRLLLFSPIIPIALPIANYAGAGKYLDLFSL